VEDTFVVFALQNFHGGVVVGIHAHVAGDLGSFKEKEGRKGGRADGRIDGRNECKKELR
jgi:hypothetical protein